MIVLLVGFGGPPHVGAFLSDAIVLGALRPRDGEIRLLSIPRDLVVAWPLGSASPPVRKINQVFALESAGKSPIAGLMALEAVVYRWFGVETDASIALDFTGFIRLVDSTGGVSMTVERPFEASYPASEDPAAGWNTVRFLAGEQMMSGERLLAFVRARYAQGIEGSDFARMRRQQLTTVSLLRRRFNVRQMSTLPAALWSLRGHVWWHMNGRQLPSAIRAITKIKESRSLVLSTDNHLAEFTLQDLGYVLVPEKGIANLHKVATDFLFGPSPGSSAAHLTHR